MCSFRRLQVLKNKSNEKCAEFKPSAASTGPYKSSAGYTFPDGPPFCVCTAELARLGREQKGEITIL